MAELKIALPSKWNNLPHILYPRELIDKQSRHFERDFDHVLLQLVDIFT